MSMMFCDGCCATRMRSMLNPASRMITETKYPQAILPCPGMVAVPLKSHGCPSQQCIMGGSLSSIRVLAWFMILSCSDVVLALRKRSLSRVLSLLSFAMSWLYFSGLGFGELSV